ncbi:response regulator transcription factor [Pseudoflavitalea sp. X16]|uniref:LytR/AlgR family response regulator transcription factor n=1 Tax=Paraflavitalea devenefica TaxID=2716334 RepID=UPI001423C9FD|nr:LytTR family DNA-binding domain-containing protein [Paraflavitalea devenefica]NII27079.1 response regulator transcription factor [Paraflavitalea devenefica]
MKAIIVDDEKHCRESLQSMLQMYCPGIQVMATCADGLSALTAIETHKPDILFLDIEMPRMNAFDLLQQLDAINFEIIFTTAYDQYAIRAIKCSALDYLLKPIDAEELKTAVERISSRPHDKMEKAKVQQVVNNMSDTAQHDFRLIIATLEGNYFLLPDEIMYCEGSDNYTHFHLTKGRKLVSAKTLKEYEEMLTGQGFLRIHKSWLVNLKFAVKFSKANSTLIMEDYTALEVSRRKKEAVINALFNK